MKKPADPAVIEAQPFFFPAAEDPVHLADPTPPTIVYKHDLVDDFTGPILPITTDEGDLDPFWFQRLVATMLYPHDEATRREFLALTETARIDDPGDLSHLLPTGRVTELLQAEVMNTRWKGLVAGRLLWWAIWLAIQAPPASLNKAVFLLEHQRQQETEVWKGPKKRSYIWDCWTEHKSVSHFWTIWGGNLVQDEIVRSIFETETVIYESHWQSVLAGVETFRRLGMKHRYLSDTWRLPANLHLPNVRMPVPTLPSWALTALKRYRS